MKKWQMILLAGAICVSLMLGMTACAGTGKDKNDESKQDNDPVESQLETPDGSENESDNSYINSAPANEEQGWGPIIPRP